MTDKNYIIKNIIVPLADLLMHTSLKKFYFSYIRIKNL